MELLSILVVAKDDSGCQREDTYIPHINNEWGFILEICQVKKPHVLRYFYHELTGDSLSSDTSDQAEIHDCLRQIINLEDPDIIADLRTLNSPTSRAKFGRFWSDCEAILDEEVGVAVDDWRHSEVTHLATATSIRDL